MVIGQWTGRTSKLWRVGLLQRRKVLSKKRIWIVRSVQTQLHYAVLHDTLIACIVFQQSRAENFGKTHPRDLTAWLWSCGTHYIHRSISVISCALVSLLCPHSLSFSVVTLPVLYKQVGDGLLFYTVVQKKTAQNSLYHVDAPVLQNIKRISKYTSWAWRFFEHRYMLYIDIRISKFAGCNFCEPKIFFVR